MNASDLKEIINTVFEGLISLAVIVGAGLMVAYNPSNTTVVGAASASGMAVITFWFGQRGQVKAVNGNITALANIASQMVRDRVTTPPPSKETTNAAGQ